jgi:hypothetical protein
VIGRPRPNFRLAKLLFIREASASFEHTHNTSCGYRRSAQVLKGEATATRCDVVKVLGLSLGYILVKWCATLP